MADLSDVENALVTEVIGALYPAGLTGESAVGVTCRVYRGWPSPATLNSDLTAGNVNVSVFPATAADELLAVYLDQPRSDSIPISLSATVTAQSIAFSGSVESDQIVGILIDGIPFSYRVINGDTTESIAANLGALIQIDRIVTLSGSSLIIPDAGTVIARVVTNATVSRTIRRQRREVHVSCWCPSPALRDAVCKTVDIALARSSFIDLADRTMMQVHYATTQLYDQSQNALLYRRDLCYNCQYVTLVNTNEPVMLFGDLFNNGNGWFV